MTLQFLCGTCLICSHVTIMQRTINDFADNTKGKGMNEPTDTSCCESRANSPLWLLLQSSVHIFLFWLVFNLVTIAGPKLGGFAASGHTQLPGIVQWLLDLSHRRGVCYGIFFTAVVIDITALAFFRVLRPNPWLLRIWVSCVWMTILLILGLLFAAFYISFWDLIKQA